MKLFQHQRGETILEVLIAISVFTIIIGPASALYISSVRSTAINRNNLIGAALAEEGVEMVRNIRDTNFLKFSPKAGQCWDTMPEHSGLDDCDAPANKIAGEAIGPTQFVLNIDSNTLALTLTQATGTLVNADNENFRIEQGGSETPYYRQISIGYLDPIPADGIPPEAMLVTSLVQYRISATRIQSISRQRILTNRSL